jgi:uncharacterized membrane protein (DUF106 family)
MASRRTSKNHKRIARRKRSPRYTKSKLQKMSTSKVQSIARSLEAKAKKLRSKGQHAAAKRIQQRRSRILQNAL